MDHYLSQTANTQKTLKPTQALELLKAGNRRFVNQQIKKHDFMAQVKSTSGGQFPFAAILSCIDSRLPTEIIFDQGIGAIFNARVAGNVINPDILGSLEFACKVSGSKLIVVMGHSNCGAVKGAVDNIDLGNLTGLLQKIKPAIKQLNDEIGHKNVTHEHFLQKVAEKNVAQSIWDIKNKSSVLKHLLDTVQIMIIGAMYDVASGKVLFWE